MITSKMKSLLHSTIDSRSSNFIESSFSSHVDALIQSTESAERDLNRSEHDANKEEEKDRDMYDTDLETEDGHASGETYSDTNPACTMNYYVHLFLIYTGTRSQNG